VKRPVHIRVLGKRLSIKYVPEGDALLCDNPEDTEPGIGRFSPANQLIVIQDGQPLGMEQDTVLHEVLHAVETAMSLPVNEEIVEKFATCLLAVIKDNPGLLAYLKTKEK